MKSRILDQQVAVYSQPDLTSQVLGNLSGGTEVEIEDTRQVGEEKWLVLKGANGRRGYIPGKTRVLSIRPLALNQRAVTAYQRPEPGAPVSREYTRGMLLTPLDMISQDGMSWLKVSDKLGNEGYINGNTRLGNGDASVPIDNPIPTAQGSPLMNAATQRIVIGGLMVGGGVAFYFIVSPFSSVVAILGVASGIFGLRVLLRGLYLLAMANQ